VVSRALGIALALLLLAPVAARAQDAQTRARTLFEQGVTALDGGNPALAAQYFEQSYQAYPRASTACNMALALERTQRGCDAEGWYRQCAALDQEGRFRDHANRQAAALGAQCAAATPPPSPTPSPFVGGAPPPSSGGVQIVEAPPQTGGYPTHTAEPNHALLAVGLVALGVGAGAIIGGAFAADEATYQASWLPTDTMILIEGTPEAERYASAETYSNLALGLYVSGALVSTLGAILFVTYLGQPGIGGSAATTPAGPRLSFGPLPEGGGFADLRLRF
jgi:hypothetical protein